jgi:hypothetical protein
MRHYSFDPYVTQNFVSDPVTFLRRWALEEASPLDPIYRISHDYGHGIRIARRHDPLVLRRQLAAFRMAEGTLSTESFERQFREHAEVPRRRAGDRRLPVAVNVVMSGLIVAVPPGDAGRQPAALASGAVDRSRRRPGLSFPLPR